MVFKSKDVEKSLTKKGFKKEPRDHYYFVLYVDGKRTKVKTKLSHNGQDIDDYLIKNMSKQVHLDKVKFCDLINCPLSENEYKKILKENGVINY